MPDAVSAESPVGGGGLLEYWRTLFRHKRLMTAFALAGALAGYLYCLPQTPTFQAATSVEVTELNESFLNMTNLDPSARTYSDESKLLTEMKMLESKSLRRLVRENLLAEPAPPRVYERDQLSALLEALGLPQYRAAPSYEGAIAMAASTLQIRNPRQTRIVEILCDSNDPKVAADFVNALTQTYIDETIQGRLSSFQRTTEWLNSQLDEIRVKLSKSQDELLAYAKASGLVLTGEAEQKLRTLQGELSDAQRDVYIRDALYEVAKSSPPGTLPQALDHNLVQTYERQLADKEAELVRSRTSLAPQHYRVQALETELSHLRSALKEARSTVVKRVENEFSAARIRRDLLEQAYVDHSREVSNQSDKVIHYNMLKQEADTNQELYRSMTQRLKEANIASAMRASTVRVVDPAEPAGSPSSPNPVRSCVIGFSTGIFVAVLFVFVRSSSNEKFQSPGDAATYLQVPEWGVIPSVQKPVRQGRLFLNLLGTRPDSSNGTAKNGHTLISPGKDSAELVTWNWKPSVHAESFRAVLASLLAHSAESRTYVIASPEASAGKSTTTCNLGIALAEIGRRVVVVDADLRNPRLHKVFDVPSTWGLTSIINDSVPVEDLPKEALAKPTSIENLYLLPSGPGVASISRLFYSPRLKQTLARLREDFDMVLIDTPPMLQFADARALAQCADDVILVFRAAHTARRTGLAALQKFQEDGVEVRGIILNDWNPSFTGDNSYNFKLKVSYKP